ncbi:MAG: hypothetical protein K6C08_08065 [Oscillospiraceae bacterium]|nr:hypothetical protein [Oscillospiraceae bacterium]
MKRNIRMMLSVLLVFCFATALMPVHANAAINGQATVVIVDQDKLSPDVISQLVPARRETIYQILNNTNVCEETKIILTEAADGSSEETVVEAFLHFGSVGIAAETQLANGQYRDTPGHAVVEAKGEFQFSDISTSAKTMCFGFVKEKSDDPGYRYYSTATVQILGVLLGAMAKDTVLFIEDKCYTFDENGYCDITQTGEADAVMKQTYINTTYYHGLAASRIYDTNPFVLTQHAYDFQHPVGSLAATKTHSAVLYYRCACENCTSTVAAESIYGDHRWSEWTRYSEPHPDDPGIESRICTVCGETETRYVTR